MMGDARHATTSSTESNSRHDIFTPAKRSEIMSHVKGRDTKLEVRVRSALHRAGYRFRLYRRDLPGIPDIVLPKYRTAVFVHGCFWHQHPGCRKATIPKSNHDFWEKKLRSNLERDNEVQHALKALGWRVVVLWECEIRRDFPGAMANLLQQLQGRSP